MPKIQDYPAVTAPTDADVFVVVQGGVTKQETGAQVRQGLIRDNDARLTDRRPVTVRKNTGSDIGTRRRLNFIEGTNVTLGITDDAANDEIDITITAAGGGGGGGEVNTASNAGTAGIGVYDSKSGVDLQFRNINAASTKISVALDAANKEIDLDVPDASTTQKGAVQLAAEGATTVGRAVQASDARLSDNRALEIAKAGTLVSTRKRLNFIDGSNATVTVADNAVSDRIDITVASTGGGAAVDPLAIYEVKDDFLFNSSESGEVGGLGWSFSGGTVTQESSSTSHPGIVRLTSNAASGAIGRLTTSTNAVTGVVAPADVDYFYFVVKPVEIVNMSLRIGLMADLANTEGGTDGIYFMFDPASNANWITRTRASSTNTDNTTGVAVTSGNWYYLRFVRNGANWEFHLNGSLVFTHTTNVPTSILPLGIVIRTSEAVTKSVDVDLFYFRTKTLGQRWS